MAPLRIGCFMLLLQVVGIGQDGARLGKRDHIAGGCLRHQLIGRAAAAKHIGGDPGIGARFLLGLGFDIETDCGLHREGVALHGTNSSLGSSGMEPAALCKLSEVHSVVMPTCWHNPTRASYRSSRFMLLFGSSGSTAAIVWGQSAEGWICRSPG